MENGALKKNMQMPINIYFRKKFLPCTGKLST